MEEFPQFHSYCILFSTFQPTITGTVSTVVVHYGKHTFGITSIGKHPFCIIHLLTNHFANVFDCFHFQNWFPNELSFSILVLFGNVLSFSKCARFCERFFSFFQKTQLYTKICTFATNSLTDEVVNKQRNIYRKVTLVMLSS